MSVASGVDATRARRWRRGGAAYAGCLLLTEKLFLDGVWGLWAR